MSEEMKIKCPDCNGAGAFIKKAASAIFSGGLLMRARTSREPVYHKGSLPLGKHT